MTRKIFATLALMAGLVLPIAASADGSYGGGYGGYGGVGSYGYSGYSPSYTGAYIQNQYGQPYYSEYAHRYIYYPEYTWPTYNCGLLVSYTVCGDTTQAYPSYQPGYDYGSDYGGYGGYSFAPSYTSFYSSYSSYSSSPMYYSTEYYW
jgi:hypothetical protein